MKKPLSKSKYIREAYPLKGMSEEDYESVLMSGMFWVWYPDATGIFRIDCEGADASKIGTSTIGLTAGGETMHKAIKK